MSAPILQAVQQALYNKLTADSVLMGAVEGVYDAVPQHATLPYVVIGDGQAENAAQVETEISECKLSVNVWTDGGGRKVALSILTRLYELLHQGTLNFTGFTLISMRGVRAETQVDATNNRIQGTLELALTMRED